MVIFLAGAIGTFPLLVPPFFLPLYCRSIGLSSGTGAGLVAGFNFSSAVSRIACGFFCDQFGSLNTLFASMLLGAISMLALWPASTTFGPMVAFVIINGAANGGFFAVMPTVVGNVFGSARVSVAMGMIATGWMGGYLLVCFVGPRSPSPTCTDVTFSGRAHCGLLARCLWRCRKWPPSVPPCHVLRWLHGSGRIGLGVDGETWQESQPFCEGLMG